MAPPAQPPGWLVLCDRFPGPDAGLPEDRERARRIQDLAAVVPGSLTVATVEVGLGARDGRWLAHLGGTLADLGPDPVGRLRSLLDAHGAVLATTTQHVALLLAAGWAPDRTPLVLDLLDLPSARHAAAGGALAGVKLDGHETLVQSWFERDLAALGGARLVLTAHDELRPLIDADAVAVRLAVDVQLVGLDADPRFRLLAHDGATAGPRDVDRALRAAAVAVVARPRGIPVPARLLELARLGVPVVATTGAGGTVAYDADALVAAIEPLLDDAAARDRARGKGFARVEADHAPDRCRAALAEALQAAELEATPRGRTKRPVTTVDPGPARAGAAGSLAAMPPDAAAFDRELFAGPLLSRIQAIRLEHPADEDRRYRLWASTWNRPNGPTHAPAPPAVPDVGISILVPTWNTPPAVLEATIESVLAQTDGRWQLCIADDASPERATHHVLDRYAAADPRITVVRLDENQGIAGASNAALGLATLPYVGLLDHDDLLRPDAVEWMLRRIEREPDLDYLYSDEDKLDPYGLHAAPYCKPDWNPDLLLSCNYLTHFSVLRRSLVEEVGGFRGGFDGSQDYDLLLRVTERTDRIAHVARPLYAWRQIEGSTSVDTSAKPAAHDAGRRALLDALERRGIDAEVSEGFMPTWHRVHYRHEAQPLVTVVIPTRDRLELVRGCVERVRKTVRYPNLELLVVDNQSTDRDTLAWLAQHERAADGAVVRYPHDFSYARQMNMAAAAARGSVLLMLNNDARPRSTDWFEAMLEHALRPEVGVVGARLRFPDGRAQHEGIILNVGGPAYNLDTGGKAEWGRTIRDVVAVTGAAMMCRTAVYHEAGGFEERLRVAFNDVDFCLRVGELGYRIVYTPYAELEHQESASRGALHPMDDEAYYLERWGPPYAIRDPFYNHAMDLMHPLILRV